MKNNIFLVIFCLILSSKLCLYGNSASRCVLSALKQQVLVRINQGICCRANVEHKISSVGCAAARFGDIIGQDYPDDLYSKQHEDDFLEMAHDTWSPTDMYRIDSKSFDHLAGQVGLPFTPRVYVIEQDQSTLDASSEAAAMCDYVVISKGLLGKTSSLESLEEINPFLEYLFVHEFMHVLHRDYDKIPYWEYYVEVLLMGKISQALSTSFYLWENGSSYDSVMRGLIEAEELHFAMIEDLSLCEDLPLAEDFVTLESYDQLQKITDKAKAYLSEGRYFYLKDSLRAFFEALSRDSNAYRVVSEHRADIGALQHMKTKDQLVGLLAGFDHDDFASCNHKTQGYMCICDIADHIESLES